MPRRRSFCHSAIAAAVLHADRAQKYAEMMLSSSSDAAASATRAFSTIYSPRPDADAATLPTLSSSRLIHQDMRARDAAGFAGWLAMSRCP